jgi:RHS repeat-associated protein
MLGRYSAFSGLILVSLLSLLNFVYAVKETGMAKAGMSVVKIAGAVLLILVAASLSWGQMPDIPDKGFRPFGSYQLSDIDAVNLTNGNLIVHIPIVSYPQRGDVPPLSLSVRFNNPRWSVKFQYNGQTNDGNDMWFAYWGDDGAGTEIVRDNTYSLAEYDYNLYNIDPNEPGAGVIHIVDSLGAHHAVEQTSGDPNQGFFRSPMESIDGTGLKVDPSGCVYSGGLCNAGAAVTDGNGVRHIMANINVATHPVPPDLASDQERVAYEISTANGFAESTEDANGNKITALPGRGWTDTMGRFIPAPQEVSSCETLNFPGANGGTAPIKFCYGSNGTAIQSNFGLSSVFDGDYQGDNFSFVLPYIASITLANGTSWQFHYNNFGFISSITLPTGGTISYNWQVSPQCAGWLQMMRNRGGTPQWHGASETCEFMVTSRTFNANDGSAPQTWSYAGDIPSNTSGLVTVTDPEGNDIVHTFGGGFDNALYETKTQYFNGPQGNNQLVKTVDTEYPAGYIYQFNQPNQLPCGSWDSMADGQARGPVINPISKTTTWAATNQVSKTTFTYDSGAVVLVSVDGISKSSTCPLTYGKVIQESEYDYGYGAPGPLLRTTNTQYQAFHDSNYLANNLLDLVYSTQVTDGSGSQVAYSYNEYDQTGLQPSGVSTQFDTNPAGAPYRGNLTTAHRWLNTSGGYLNTTTSYYDTGTPYQATDAKGNTTTYFYDPAFAGAYVTKVQMPTTSNGVQHSVSASYDFNTGLKTSSTDQNQQTTSYTYDNMGRLTSVTGPADASNGGQSSQTIYTYYDVPNVATPISTAQQSIDGRQTLSWTLFDGFGRATRTATWNDEGNSTDQNYYDQVDTCYDGLGQKYYTSYPYRSTGFNASKACSNSQEPGDTFNYDALGRVTNVTNADGGVVSTDYSQFPTTTATDQAGASRRNRTDALGRLLEVDEPGVPAGAPRFATSGSGSATVAGSEQTIVGPAPGKGWAAVSGSEQSVTNPGTQATASVTVTGSEQTYSYSYWVQQTCYDDMGIAYDCSYWATGTAYDTGSVTLTINGYTRTMGYGQSTDAANMAYWFAQWLNSDSASPVTASVNGATLYFTSKATGAAANYAVTTSSSSDGGNVNPPSFGFSSSAFNLTGGTDGSTTYDSGTVWIKVNGTLYGATYGQGDTAATFAAKLTNALASSPVVTASLSGSTINLVAKQPGSGTNYTLSTSSSDPLVGTTFSHPSFTVSVSGAHLVGGLDSGQSISDTGTVYVSINGKPYPASYGAGDKIADVVSRLQTALGPSPVNTTPAGSVITLTAKTAGAATNYPLAAGASSSQPILFSAPSFAVTASGASLSGGADVAVPSFSTPTVTLYSYDTLDNLVGVQQQGNDPNSANWRPRSFVYDSLSRLLTANNPESGTIHYSYDANGNLVSKTSPAPNVQPPSTATQTISYCYDQLNRVTGKVYAAQSGCPLSSPAVSYAYDAGSNGIGHVTSVTDHAGSGSYSYDVMGRMSGEQRTIAGVSKSLNYAYNLDGSLKTMTYPSGRVVSYGYNAAQRPLSAVDNNGNNFAFGARYTAWGSLSSVGNGGMTTFDYYNSRMQPCRLVTGSPGVGPSSNPCGDPTNLGNVLDLSYDFHYGQADNGNVYQVTNNKNSARTQQFGYDALNRLAWAWTPNTTSPSTYWGQNYGYDNWGNLLLKNVAGGDTSLNLAVNGKNQVTSWCYDAAGNVVGVSACSSYPNNAFPNVFDAENRLTQTTVSGVTSSYDYDADGERVKKLGSTNTLYWYGLGGEVLEETDLNGGFKNDYVFFGGKRVARIGPPPSCPPPAPGQPPAPCPPNVQYYFADHLGSADVITDVSGNIKEESDYYPFGGERVITDSGIGNNYKFTGKERDPETGCDYFGARYYCNPIGRFITPDWADKPTDVPYANFGNPQSLNLYSYVQNNPTTFGDSDGHTCEVCPNLDDLKRLVDEGGAEGRAMINAARSTVAATVTRISIGATVLIAAYAASPYVATVGQSESAERAMIAQDDNEEAEKQQQEPQADASGAGARKGGGKGPFEPTKDNINRMESRRAPIGTDGHSVELHHDGQKADSPLKEMTRTEHRGGANFKKNHPNTGQKPSQINRTQFKRTRADHWEKRANDFKHQP